MIGEFLQDLVNRHRDDFHIVNVGIPTKSGVGGGLLAAYSGVGGIGTFSPALDAVGNSVAGQNMMQEVSEKLGLDILMPSLRTERLL